MRVCFRPDKMGKNEGVIFLLPERSGLLYLKKIV